MKLAAAEVAEMTRISAVFDQLAARLRPAVIGPIVPTSTQIHWECGDCGLGCCCSMILRHDRCYGLGHE